MKAIFKIQAIILLGAVTLWSCEDDVVALRHTAPEVSFPIEESSMTARVGEAVEFKAEIKQGDRLTCGWYVNETLEASTPTMSYTFEAPGTYEVRFSARNGAGEVKKSYSVSVGDVLQMHLSVGDSTLIQRLQLDYLRVAAIVDSGSDVRHEWSVDGVVKSDQAYFDTFNMPDAKIYAVSYKGVNTAGTFTKSFDVQALERPLEIEFSNTDATISVKDGAAVEITATVKYGGTGIQHEWSVDDTVVSSAATFNRAFSGEGPYTITYKGVNAKLETVTRSWTVRVMPSGVLFEDFESYTALPDWWRKQENTPGITLEENPKKEGINTSEKVMRDQVSGTGGTSGYFTLETSKLLAGKDIDVSKYTGIRFKVYLGKNKYYPRVDIGGTKYASVTAPQFKDEWETLEYRFPFNLDPTKIIQFRPLLQENGSNIASGAVSDTNTRTVYIDDIEFLE
ncbi:PKD domain-containing protein [uncultured Alistipes sp.]|jgi:PKD domain|uniref:PKD-like domain-containing protein n=1 Tax=uncultured Alistipes sp. TaxID=538949 RepID=UPI0025DAA00D|nr:PKD domain-containing protein [uncultured Alistipes sp.]